MMMRQPYPRLALTGGCSREYQRAGETFGEPPHRAGSAALSFPRRLGRLRLVAANRGQQRIERLFGGHFFAAALVLPVLVLAVAGTAARQRHLFPVHGHDRVVGRALAARTVIVNIVAQSHLSPRSF